MRDGSPESLLVGRGEGLRPLLWKQATRWANFSISPSGERLLASFGTGAESVVEAVLLAADRPLHYEEIARLCLSRGKSVWRRDGRIMRRPTSAFFWPGAPTVWSSISSCPMISANIISETEDMLSENTVKQWHTAEIFEGLEERGLDFGGRMSTYVVNFVLKGSKFLRISDVWFGPRNQTRPEGTADRIEVWQAVAAMLQENGGRCAPENAR